MTRSKYIQCALTILAAIGGLYFVGLGGQYLIDYLRDTPNNPVRHEYLQGMLLSLILSLPFWVIVALFAVSLKSAIPKKYFLVIVAPAIIFGVAFILLNIITIVMILIHK